MPEEVQVEIKEGDEIEYLGNVKQIVNNVLLIEHISSHQTLNIGSILCLKDRRVLGKVWY